VSPLRLQLPAPCRGRLAVLDELKGVAIILVILYHAGGVLVWQDKLHGEVGVDMFVILSGIGLTLSNTQVSVGNYLSRRFWRIYPAYWIVLTVFLVVDRYVRHLEFPSWDIFLHYTGFHAWFGDGHAMSINDSFWFITLIVSLYLVYLPLRGLVARPDLLLLAGAVLSLVAAISYFYAGQSAGFAHLSLRLPGFFLGLLVGRLLKNGCLEIPMTAALALAVSLIFYLPYVIGFEFLSIWVGAALMAAYAFLVRPLLSATALRGLKYLGDRSLEIFLIHQPLIRDYNFFFLQKYFPGAIDNPWYRVMGMAVGLVIAIEASGWLHRLLRKLPQSGTKSPSMRQHEATLV
jgi:peptidoglycan/LPS O-acetylase OafA/YrhL